ncbi:MAG: bacteriohemerythrin [Candidatus Andersenbacteria bacterium]|nr:bacteriohemerythrin [bacterium]MDZ4225268.1 bacteriohemerythrin [Candidatus Andersenbacteria bacterium]
MQIVWDKSHEIGIKVIDGQHEQFFKIMNKILTLSAKKKTSRRELEAIIFQLSGYALFHFSVEEGYFGKSGYPGTKAHKLAHQMYRDKVTELMDKIKNPKTDLDKLAAEIATFSIRWLARHTLQEDKRYAEWAKRNSGRAR